MINSSSVNEAFSVASQKDPVLHYDIDLKPGVAYLIYVGEIKICIEYKNLFPYFG